MQHLPTLTRRELLQQAAMGVSLAAPGHWAAAQGRPALPTLSGTRPLVIAHRGASAYRPEHTLAAYELAIEQGADYIEPDLVMTRDGELIARHEPMLARVELNPDGSLQRQDGKPVLNRSDTSTNVWQLPRYADRLQVKTLDGRKVGGWWAEDFTAAEIRDDIRAQERLRDLRSANNSHNDLLTLPTLQEVVALARRHSARLGRSIGIYPETKHPSYTLAFSERLGLQRMEDKLLSILHASYGNVATAPVYIQSFEVSNLRYLSGRTQLRLVQLLSALGRPYDFVLSGDLRTHADLAQAGAQGLDFIAAYADGVGPHTDLLIPPAGDQLGSPTALVGHAHAVGLQVHGWTFRAENRFLPKAFNRGEAPAAPGDMQGQLAGFFALGMDGFFTDQPDLGVAAVAAWQGSLPAGRTTPPARLPLRRRTPAG